MFSRRIVPLTVVLVLVAALTAPAGAQAPEQDGAAPIQGRHTGPDYNDGRLLPFAEGSRTRAARATSGDFQATAKIGDRKFWFALDDELGEIYVKPFRLRGKGQHVEVWVTPDLTFPAGDCRNGDRTQVTRAQISYLVKQFDNVIYPKMSRAFSRPPDRNGSDSIAHEFINVGRRYYRGDGDNIVVLVDNVRDDNYYDTNNELNNPYIIGFFYSPFNDLTDRNVMTIDGFDWIHRTGANPIDEPDPIDICNSKPARPFLIEETFAHEYQHLLMHYEDRNETTWLNEGMADWAQTVAGYSQPARRIDEPQFDRHIQCFLGFCGVASPFNPNPSSGGGPENSLTIWEDQPPEEILAEYGATYTFMEFLSSRHGRSFMKSMHRDNANGLKSLQKLLTNINAQTTAAEVLIDWAAAMALDRVLDAGAALTGADPADLTASTLSAAINWDSPETHSTAGAPPNGSDYVRLRDAAGLPLGAAAIDTISFQGTPATGKTFTVRLVAYDNAGTAAWAGVLPLDAASTGSLTAEQVDALIGSTAETVAAIVTYHDQSETETTYAPYQLTVNGVLQPGG